MIENIIMENVTAGHAKSVMEIATEVLYQWRTLVPTYEKRLTRIDGLHMRDVHVKSADVVYLLDGCPELPARNITMHNVTVDTVKKYMGFINNVENVSILNLSPSRPAQPNE